MAHLGKLHSIGREKLWWFCRPGLLFQIVSFHFSTPRVVLYVPLTGLPGSKKGSFFSLLKDEFLFKLK